MVASREILCAKMQGAWGGHSFQVCGSPEVRNIIYKVLLPTIKKEVICAHHENGKPGKQSC